MTDDAPKRPPAKRARQPSRPRLDAVIRHIKSGSYDDDMGMLQGAIADRQRIRQEAVAKLVQQTFGEDYVIAPKDATPAKEKPNPFLERAAMGSPERLAPEELAAAEQAALAREAELAQSMGDGLPEDPESGDIESRSPVIGSVPRDGDGTAERQE